MRFEHLQQNMKKKTRFTMAQLRPSKDNYKSGA